jgi:hypothetical protein
MRKPSAPTPRPLETHQLVRALGGGGKRQHEPIKFIAEWDPNTPTI